jgi:hypothetical protein
LHTQAPSGPQNLRVHMGYVKRLTTTLVVMFTVGCSSSQPPPPAKTVFDPLTRELDKAREVQKNVDENAERTRQAIDNQARGDTP